MVEIYFRYYNLPAEESAMAQIKNPMCEVFPRVASCTYWRYGSGGGQTRKYILSKSNFLSSHFKIGLNIDY